MRGLLGLAVLVAGAALVAWLQPSTAAGQELGEGATGAPHWFDLSMHVTALSVEFAGVAVIVAGAILSSWVFFKRWRDEGYSDHAYHGYRANLGRGILLGLELLVAADIVRTIAVELTFESLGVLAVIVLIRTFLSFTLEVEIEGRWPWQEKREVKTGQRPKM